MWGQAIVASTSRKKLFWGIGDSTWAWFPAPDSPQTATNVQWGASAQLTNGFNMTAGSAYGARHYELTWSFLLEDDAEAFRRLFMGRKDELVWYQDPFAAENLVSPLMGLPYMHTEVYTPLFIDDDGTTCMELVPATDRRADRPGVILTSAPVERTWRGALPLVKSSRYAERLWVPPDEPLYVYVSGVMAASDDTIVEWWVGGVVKKQLKTNTLELVQPPSSTPVCGDLTFTNKGKGSRVYNVQAQFRQFSTDPEYWRHPRGGGNMRIVPNTATLTTVNAAKGFYAASLTLEEVWAWA